MYFISIILLIDSLAVPNSGFGGTMVITNVTCSGNETQPDDCGFDISTEGCLLAGVQCNGKL